MRNTRIFVAGHRGLIGSALVRRLEREGCESLLLCERQRLDLTDRAAVFDFFLSERPELVFMAAGKVGGIMENQRRPSDFIIQNLRMQTNIIEASDVAGVSKLFFFGSSCMYPRDCVQPMKEEHLLTGEPEPTSIAYAVAKLAGVYSCLAYNQFSRIARFIPLIPNSTYGPNDNFDPDAGHVMASLINRFHDAKNMGRSSVCLWGSGLPSREFIHSDDVADCAVFLAKNKSLEVRLPLNVGTGVTTSIRDLAETIASVVGFKGRLVWDPTKPDGAPRKLLDVSRINALGWKSKISLREGIQSTYEWFLNEGSHRACD